MSSPDLAHAYRWCGTKNTTLDVTVPIYHSLSYRGPALMDLVVHFQKIPTIFEPLTVNQSTRIQNLTGIFQRNFIIDVTDQRLSLKFTVRRFSGVTDFCKYGGLSMFNHVDMAVEPNVKKHIAHIPFDKSKHNVNESLLQNAVYFPICTNDSFIFKSRFHMDLGQTYLIFYSYNNMFTIDVTLDIYPSIYIALFNIDENYCDAQMIELYKFSDFYINCEMLLIKFLRKVPFIVQFSGDSFIPLKDSYRKDPDFLWPGRMAIEVYDDQRNIEAYNTDNHLCKTNAFLRIKGTLGITNVQLNGSRTTRRITHAESLIIHRSFYECIELHDTSYSIAFNPTVGDTRCVSSYMNYNTKLFSSTFVNKLKYLTLTKPCTFLDLTITRGNYVLYIMEAFYQSPVADNWIYYYLKLNEDCNRRSGIGVSLVTMDARYTGVFYFQFPRMKSQFVFYDFGMIRFLYFHIDSFLQGCKAIVEIISTPSAKGHTVVKEVASFKV